MRPGSGAPDRGPGPSLATRSQHAARAERRLLALRDSLAARAPQSRGRQPTVESDRCQVDRILSAQHLRNLFPVEIYAEDRPEGPKRLVQLRFRRADDHLEHLQHHLFGRRVWVTSRRDWDDVKVIHMQASLVAAYRQIHAPDHVAWQPMFHSTDQKIRREPNPSPSALWRRLAPPPGTRCPPDSRCPRLSTFVKMERTGTLYKGSVGLHRDFCCIARARASRDGALRCWKPRAPMRWADHEVPPRGQGPKPGAPARR